MQEWVDMIIGAEQVYPEIIVIVKLVGVCFMIELALSAIAFLSGIKR